MNHRFPLAAALLLIARAGLAAPEGDGSISLDPGRFPFKGSDGAGVVVVEFSDFKCHACEKFSLTIMPNLEKEFIDPGLVKVAFVDFPLIDQDHYTTVAESCHCAGDQGRYWEMQETIWANIGALSDDHLRRYAEGLGLKMKEFGACLDSDAKRARVLDGLAFTNGLGLSARPTFFIGRRDPEAGENTWTGRFIKGTQTYLIYRSVIRRMLTQADAAP